jgi:uncharacterized membrane protein YuzA (DUF378 family)
MRNSSEFFLASSLLSGSVVIMLCLELLKTLRLGPQSMSIAKLMVAIIGLVASYVLLQYGRSARELEEKLEGYHEE